MINTNKLREDFTTNLRKACEEKCKERYNFFEIEENKDKKCSWDRFDVLLSYKDAWEAFKGAMENQNKYEDLLCPDCEAETKHLKTESQRGHIYTCTICRSQTNPDE